MAGRKTILIADDEPHVTYMLAHRLEAEGFETVVVNNGSEALTLALTRNPALIITDYQMPVISGFEMCVMLREKLGAAAIPIIMLTARGHHLSEADIERAGIRILLAKPFSLKDILEKIHKALNDAAAAEDGARTTKAAAA